MLRVSVKNGARSPFSHLHIIFNMSIDYLQYFIENSIYIIFFKNFDTIKLIFYIFTLDERCLKTAVYSNTYLLLLARRVLIANSDFEERDYLE